MSTLDERLNQIVSHGASEGLDDDFINSAPITSIPIVKYDSVPSKDVAEPVTDYDDDYILTRETLRGVLERSKGVLDTAILAAVNTENPRYIDSIASLMTVINKTSKDLLDIHGKQKTDKSKQTTIIQTNNYNIKEEIKSVDAMLDTLDDDVIDAEIIEEKK